MRDTSHWMAIRLHLMVSLDRHYHYNHRHLMKNFDEFVHTFINGGRVGVLRGPESMKFGHFEKFGPLNIRIWRRTGYLDP